MPSLSETLQAISTWQRETFPQHEHTAHGAAHHLQKEVHEIFDLLFDEPRRRPVSEVDTAALAEECADVVFMVQQIMTAIDRDLETWLAWKLEKNKARKWKAPDSDGVVEHIEEGPE